jgi:cytochrome c oxidase cbb3-type subunit 4
MDTYTLLREFAASWMLLVMMLFFVGVVLWTLRPGSKKIHDDIAQIPLRNDTPGDDRDG